jgi:mannosyltransferase OCH1-like enzyme
MLLVIITLFIILFILILNLSIPNIKEIIYLSANGNSLLNVKKTIKGDEAYSDLIYIAPRNDIPILNHNILLKDSEDFGDYHYVIYFLTSTKFKIIIRKLDSYAINNDIVIKIFDSNLSKFDLIKIKKNYKNEIITEFETLIELHPVKFKKSKIPKVIVQTGKSNKMNLAQYNCIMSFIELNPEYTYIYFNDEAINNFLLKHFNKRLINAYNELVPGAYKADLFRYCYLYKEGGCYFDNKQINKLPIRDFLDSDDEIYLCDDRLSTIINIKMFYNAILFSKKGHILMKKAINKCIINIENRFYGSNPLETTGPLLLYQIGKEYESKAKFKVFFIFNFLRHKEFVYEKKTNRIICNICYRDYYTSYIDFNYYTWLWYYKKIYVSKTKYF